MSPTSTPARIGLGLRVHSWWAVLVAVTGPATAPVLVHRERVTLVDDPATQEPYHAAVGRPLADAAAFIGRMEEAAATAAASMLSGFASSLGTVGTVGAVGVVGATRRLPTELARRLETHALLHASDRDLYEEAVVEGAARAGLPVTTVPATGKLLEQASEALGVRLEPVLAELGRSAGRPWQKDHREATAAALVALDAVGELQRPP